ncbi:MAG: imidazole glycerol phosphate synthase subunit HisH [Spirochaetes bacterium]|nr:imidazole glycerol phosphate synthase subunit HisH [Spirochaetota bacterium]
MIGVIDSKICNIFSLTNMLKKLDAKFIIINNPDQFDVVDKLILPGVGAFPMAMKNLEKFNYIQKIKEFVKKGNFFLGICLGMQLLFEKSKEFVITKGLELIPGTIEKIETSLVLPHMGWNDITIEQSIPLLNNVKNGADVYFVHSYKANTDEKYVAAFTKYDEKIPAVVYNNNIYGTQFHPEKSMKWGEIILKNFINL